MLRTKEAENLIYNELTNWLRWGRKRDWMPVGFKCPLGFMYKTAPREDEAEPVRSRPLPIDEAGAKKFEAVVINLPERHKRAFVMYVLGKAADKNMVVIVRGREQAARLLGVREWQYHNLVRQAVNMVMVRIGCNHDLLGERNDSCRVD